MNEGTIDAHFHIFAAHQGVPGSRYIPTYDATLEAWFAAARPCGVTRGVLVQPSFLGLDNGLLLEALRAHPAALRGVAVVDPGTAPGQLKELHSAGVRGIRLNLTGRLAAFEPWRNANALWKAMQDLGWHLEVYTGVGELPLVLPHLPRDLPLVLDHLARPDAVEFSDPTFVGVLRRAEHGPVTLKASGAYRLEGRPAAAIARAWVQQLGPGCLVWGSDWPCTNHEDLARYPALLSQVGQWLGEDAVAAVARDNARRLYWPEEG